MNISSLLLFLLFDFAFIDVSDFIYFLIVNVFNELYYFYVLHIIVLSLHDSCECVKTRAELSFGCLLLSTGHPLSKDGANPRLCYRAELSFSSISYFTNNLHPGCNNTFY